MLSDCLEQQAPEKELAESAKIIAGRCKEITKNQFLVGVGIGAPDQAVEVSEGIGRVHRWISDGAAIIGWRRTRSCWDISRRIPFGA